eukprot:5176555-Prymnesium_polylepis.1
MRLVSCKAPKLDRAVPTCAVHRIAHLINGRIERCNAKKPMLTRSVTGTRACSNSSGIISTQPLSASLRHISSGSHQKAECVAHKKAVARLRGVGTCGFLLHSGTPKAIPYSAGGPYRPHKEHDNGCVAGCLVLVRIARECPAPAQRLYHGMLHTLIES